MQITMMTPAENDQPMFGDAQDRESVHFTIDKAHRSFKFNSTSSATCTTSVSVFTINSGRIALSRNFISTSSNLQFQCKTGTSLVGPKPKTVECKMSCTTPSTNDDSNGCFQNRLGSIMPGSYYTGSMVQIGEVPSHTCVRTSGSKISPIVLHQKQGSKSYTLSDRQYNSIEIFDKDKSCEVFGNDQIKQRDMGLSSITWDHNCHRIPLKQTEHNCRQGIQGEGGFFRVETRPKGVSRASSINGEPSSRFFCISTKSLITPVNSLETRSIQSGHRYNALGLVSGLPVCHSPFLPYK